MRRTFISSFLVFLLVITLIPTFTFNVSFVKAQRQIGYNFVSQRDNMNWTRFWRKINQNSDWNLEYNNGTAWTAIKSDLDIIKDFIGNDTCKITLNFTSSQSADYRLTFGINLDVKNYIHKDGSWNYTLSLGHYSVNFDWSDLISLNLELSHGVKKVTVSEGVHERWFWFRIRRDNVPKGANVVIDPTITYNEVITTINTTGQGDGWVVMPTGLPAGCIAEVILRNVDTNDEIWRGAREVGSGLDRRLQLHEAEDGGDVTARFLVTVDDSGDIELYDDLGFVYNAYVVGYWTDITWTETWIDLNVIKADESTWVDRNLFTGDPSIPKGSVALASLVNRATGNEYRIGVRTDGSGLQRERAISEAEGGGVNVISMFVKTSVADGIIEIWCEDEATDCSVIIQGYFGSDMDFVELFDERNPEWSVGWNDVDLTSVLDEDGRIVDCFVQNVDLDNEHYLGVRKEGTALNRYIQEHEAEGGGATGFGISTETDEEGKIEFYTTLAGYYYFYTTGYFKETTEEGTTENVYGSISSSVSIVGGKFVGYSTYASVAPLLTIGTQISYSISKYAYANISLSFSLASGRTITIIKYHGISPQYSLFSTNLWSFSREGAVYKLLSVDGWLQSLIGLEMYGDIQPLIVVDSSLEFAVVKHGNMEIVCQVTTSKTAEFNLYLSVSPLFVIIGNYSEEAEMIENIYGVIGQILGVDDYVLYVFESSGDVTQSIAIATSKSVSVTQLMDILLQMGLDHVSFKDLVKGININQDLTIDSLTLTDLTRIGVIDEDFIIDGLSLKELSKFGLINENAQVNSINLKILEQLGLINLDLIVNDNVLKLLNRLGTINEVIMIDGEHYTLRTILAFGAINENLVINSITFEQLIRYGVINKNIIIDGSYSTFGDVLLYGDVNLQLSINQVTYKELVRLGLISESFNINSITLEQFIRYLSVDLQFGVDSLTLEELLRYGDISETFSVGSITYEQLIRLGVISEIYSINSQTLQEMQRQGIIDETLNVNGVTLEDLIRFGAIDETYNIGSITFEQLIKAGIINETFLIDGELLTFEELLAFGTINLDLTLTDELLVAFERMGLINEYLPISDLTLKGLIRDGVINESFLVDGLTLKGLVTAGIINLDLILTDELYAELTRIGVIDESFNINGLTLQDLIRAGIIDENFVLSNTKLLDLITAGIVNEDLLVDGRKSMSFNLFGSVSETIGIESLFDSFTGVLKWIYGSIESIISVLTSSRFPLIITRYIPVSRGIVFFVAILCVGTSIILYNAKRKKEIGIIE